MLAAALLPDISDDAVTPSWRVRSTRCQTCASSMSQFEILSLDLQYW